MKILRFLAFAVGLSVSSAYGTPSALAGSKTLLNTVASINDVLPQHPPTLNIALSAVGGFAMAHGGKDLVEEVSNVFTNPAAFSGKRATKSAATVTVGALTLWLAARREQRTSNPLHHALCLAYVYGGAKYALQ